MMAVLVVSLFSDPESKVSLTATAPEHLVPGDDCLVKVVLHNNGVTGYAQLQQVLPIGLKAKPVETMGAKIEVQDNIISFIWSELPADNPLTVSYSIQTDPNETAPATLAGAFVYMQSEQAVTVEMDPVVINFSDAAKTSSVNNGDVKRKIIAATPEGGQYNVEITIHKKEGEHTARFTDNIPEGYTVTNINPCNAKFMFSNRQATFLWDPLPAEKIFKISYTLDATSSKFVNPAVEGMLVYGAEGETQTSIASSSDWLVQREVKEKEPESVPDVIASNLVAQETEKSASGNLMTAIPPPQKEIFFKIQIAATRKSPVRNDHYFENKYHLGQHVDITDHDGWRKYMLGNFDSFTSANAFSLQIREKIPDAFVVAYRNAERIPLREAVSGTVKAN